MSVEFHNGQPRFEQSYYDGIRYEAVIEAVGFRIAKHVAALDKAGSTDADRAWHDQQIDALEELRQQLHLCSDDARAVSLVELALRGSAAERPEERLG